MSELAVRQPHLGRDSIVLLDRIAASDATGVPQDDIEPYLLVRLLRCGYVRRKEADSPFFIVTPTGAERSRFEELMAKRRQDEFERREIIRSRIRAMTERLELSLTPVPAAPALRDLPLYPRRQLPFLTEQRRPVAQARALPSPGAAHRQTPAARDDPEDVLRAIREAEVRARRSPALPVPDPGEPTIPEPVEAAIEHVGRLPEPRSLVSPETLTVPTPGEAVPAIVVIGMPDARIGPDDPALASADAANGGASWGRAALVVIAAASVLLAADPVHRHEAPLVKKAYPVLLAQVQAPAARRGQQVPAIALGRTDVSEMPAADRRAASGTDPRQPHPLPPEMAHSPDRSANATPHWKNKTAATGATPATLARAIPVSLDGRRTSALPAHIEAGLPTSHAADPIGQMAGFGAGHEKEVAAVRANPVPVASEPAVTGRPEAAIHSAGLPAPSPAHPAAAVRSQRRLKRAVPAQYIAAKAGIAQAVEPAKAPPAAAAAAKTGPSAAPVPELAMAPISAFKPPEPEFLPPPAHPAVTQAVALLPARVPPVTAMPVQAARSVPAAMPSSSVPQSPARSIMPAAATPVPGNAPVPATSTARIAPAAAAARPRPGHGIAPVQAAAVPAEASQSAPVENPPSGDSSTPPPRPGIRPAVAAAMPPHGGEQEPGTRQSRPPRQTYRAKPAPQPPRNQLAANIPLHAALPDTHPDTPAAPRHDALTQVMARLRAGEEPGDKAVDRLNTLSLEAALHGRVFVPPGVRRRSATPPRRPRERALP